MTPKQTLKAVLALALLGEAVSEIFAENASAFVLVGLCMAVAGLMYRARKTS